MDSKSSKLMRDDMRALAASEKPITALSELPKRGTVAALRGIGDYKSTATGGTGGGIASPVTEQLFAQREFYPDGVRSSDGLFFIPAIKKLVMYDANNEEVIFQFAPQGEEP